MSESIADAELVERSRKRDAAAFGVLVERHQPMVFGVALARCGDPSLAEDVAQDAFVTAWRDLDRLRDAERVGSWVAGIARNLASSAVRDRSRVSELEPAETDDGTPTLEDEAIASEDRRLLLRALAEVPETFREVLVLYYMEGGTIASIAAVLGVREDLVKQRLSRGRRALRDSMASRVEAALARARVRPGFGIGVVAAVSVAGARKAAAASAAGKAIAIMTTKQLTIGIVAALVVAGAAIWLGTRRTPPDAPTHAGGSGDPAGSAAARGAAPGSGSSAKRADTPPVHVQRLGDPAQRTTLLDAIRRQRDLRANPAGAAASSPSSGTPAPALPEHELDKAYIRSAVQELIPMLTDCYEEGLTRDPKLAGDVMIDFTIEGEPDVGGVVGESAVDAAHTTIADPAVRECIQETMYAIKIDPPKDGGIIRVHYPFAFSPAPPDSP